MQRLIDIVSVSGLAARATVTIAHALSADGVGIAPDVVIADRGTGIKVVSSNTTSVTFENVCDRPLSATFLVAKMHSVQGSPITQFLGQGVVVPGMMWNSYAPLTVGNIDTEQTLLSPTAVGSLTLPANFFAAGRVLSLRTRGYISTGAGQTARMKLKVDGVDLINSIGTLPNNLVDAYIESVFDMVCYSAGGAGHIRGSGRTFIQTIAGIANVVMRPLVMTADAIVNTTLAQAIDMTYQWTNALAANTVTIVYASLDSLTL